METSALQLDAVRQNALHIAWQELAGTETTEWEVLRAAYSEPARHYHNLGHIHGLLAHAAEYRAQLQDYAAVRFAIWFHDAVYDTKRSDNEERSAMLAVQALRRLNIATPVMQAVEALILATKVHQLGDLNRDAAWFLDFDLAILGSAPEMYQAYRQAIRQEYHWVPGLLFRRKRRQVLENFLQRERLFFTAEMRERLETQARRNLQEELTLLK
jgi:predicted metal-dependent HD superfamily phosphohydrolase